MEKFGKKAVSTLCAFCFIHTTYALLKGRIPNPGGSELLTETKEFIEKLQKATSVQDIKKLQEEDGTFIVHDFSESLPHGNPQLKKTDRGPSLSCKSAAENNVECHQMLRRPPPPPETADTPSPTPTMKTEEILSPSQETKENLSPTRGTEETSSPTLEIEETTSQTPETKGTLSPRPETKETSPPKPGTEEAPSQDGTSDLSIKEDAESAGVITDIADSVTNKPRFDKESNDGQQEAAVTKANSVAAGGRDKATEAEEDVFELVDFGKSNELTEPSGEGMSGYQSLHHDGGPLTGSVERQIQDPLAERSPAEDTKDSKTKRRKNKAADQPPPTKEELEASYKYEVLAPPDNSPVKLDFPASPHAQGEEHLSQHVPLTLYCDTCMAIAFQVHLAFDKFHRQVTRRLPTESEVYHLVWEACQRSRYNEYGMLEVHGHRHISGPGCNQLEAEGGVKHSRGPWPRRLADRCQEVTEDVGELTMHEAWRREQRDPERFKTFMCFGEPPRNYCQKYGHMDAAAEAAARLRSRVPEETETPIEAANRLAREAEQVELKRLAEQGGSVAEASPDRDEL